MFSETFTESWKQRYGTDACADFPDLAPLLRHRSVRAYSEQEVTEETMQALVAAAQSAATSSNLQLWSLITVSDGARRESLAKMCADYNHVREAPWFLAFLVHHNRLRQAAKRVGENAEGMGYAEFYAMALIDVALAAERLACAAEMMGLGICYIGALRNDLRGVRELLKLPRGVFGAFGMCIGYPAEVVAAHVKPRLSQDSVWFREEYPAGEIDVSDYDERMRLFYESENMKGEVTWSMRSTRRVDGKHLTGREILMEFLKEQGLSLR